MNNRRIQNTQLTPKKHVMIRGTLTYSRLAKQIEGEELAKANERAMARGMRPEPRPYTTATITNAHVQFVNPNAKTIEEQYVEERLYTSKNAPAGVFSYTAKNNGNNLPWVAVRTAPNAVEGVTLEGELARDTEVTLVMNTFKGRQGCGIALEGVIVEGELHYFNMGPNLSDLGIVFTPAPTKTVSAKTEEEVASTVEPEMPASFGDPNGNAFSTGPQDSGIHYNPNMNNRNY